MKTQFKNNQILEYSKRLLLILLIAFFSTSAYSQAGDLLTEHVILKNYNNACGIVGIDLDGDSDKDFVATSFDGGYVCWFENDGSQNFIKHEIITNFPQASVVDVGHIDSDEDFDVVVASKSGNKIYWFENDGIGNFTQHIVVEGWRSANFVMVYNHFDSTDLDIDGDGDTDILASTGSPGNMISWFENDGNQNFTERSLKNNWYWPRYQTAYDVDRDGDMDVIGTAKAGQVIWFENDGYQNFSENILDSNWGEPSSVKAADIDKDGDIDLAATSVSANQVAWFENDGNNNFAKHIIQSYYSGAISARISDIDHDDDLDILAIAWIGGYVAVFENDGNQNFTGDVFCETAYEMITIFPIDLDSDGDLDILGANYANDDLRWWENSLYQASFSGIPNSGHFPLTVQFYDSCRFDEPIIERAWDFENDGIIDSYLQNPQWVYELPGLNTVSLKVQTNSFVKTICYNNYVKVFDGESALQFLSSEDGNAKVPASASINLTESFTLETWINPNSLGESPNLGLGRIFDKNKIVVYLVATYNNLNDTSIAIQLKHDNGSVSIANTPQNSIMLNQWQHLAVTFNGNSGLIVYVDGIEQELEFINPLSGNIADNSAYDFMVGNSTSYAFGAFDGIIDEVRVWNIVREYADIIDDMNMYLNGDEIGLVAYWKMNEGYGPEITDLSENSNNGILSNVNWCQGKNLDPPQTIFELEDSENKSINLMNFPNPFSSETTICFLLPEISHVELSIFNISGNLLATLIDTKLEKGFQTINWNGKISNGLEIESGIYYYRIKFDKTEIISKMLKIN